MKVIFIAGPFRAENQWGIECNAYQAEKAALQLAELGYIPLCPQTMYRHFHKTVTDKFWLQATRELLKRCDGILVLPGWQKSEGTKKEIELGKSLGLSLEYVALGPGGSLLVNSPVTDELRSLDKLLCKRSFSRNKPASKRDISTTLPGSGDCRRKHA